jgi:hypothetical protein
LPFELPEESKNRIIRTANLIKKGVEKFEQMPKKTRNIVAGVSFVVSGLLLPKLLFIGVGAAAFGCKHMYLNGEIEEAANEVVAEMHPGPCTAE